MRSIILSLYFVVLLSSVAFCQHKVSRLKVNKINDSTDYVDFPHYKYRVTYPRAKNINFNPEVRMANDIYTIVFYNFTIEFATRAAISLNYNNCTANDETGDWIGESVDRYDNLLIQFRDSVVNESYFSYKSINGRKYGVCVGTYENLGGYDVDYYTFVDSLQIIISTHYAFDKYDSIYKAAERDIFQKYGANDTSEEMMRNYLKKTFVQKSFNIVNHICINKK